MIRKHKITIKIDWPMLENDIKDKAYHLGMRSDNNTEDNAMIERSVTEGVAEVISMCGKYIWSKNHDSNNYLLDDDTITIVLMMPMNFNLAGCAGLGRMMHAYVTAKALTDWCRYFSPEHVQIQQQVQENARTEIKNILNSRTKVIRGANEIVIVVGKSNKPNKE